MLIFFLVLSLKNLNLIAYRILTPFLPPTTLIFLEAYCIIAPIGEDYLIAFVLSKHLMQDRLLNSFSIEDLWNHQYIKNSGLFDFGLM